MDDGIKEILVFCGITGALTGLGLSFTALSPLVIGGIVAAVPVILLTADDICEGRNSKGNLFTMSIFVASAAIGFGLAAAATTIFPGAMLGLGSAALVSATIGVIAPIAGFFVAETVDEYIISPIVECFSSKGKGYESP